MTSRPSFSKDGFYSGYDINGMYTKNSQEKVIGDNDGDNGNININCKRKIFDFEFWDI